MAKKQAIEMTDLLSRLLWVAITVRKANLYAVQWARYCEE